MIDGKVYQAICAECEESSDVDRFGVAIAWKVAHGIETEHVSIDIVLPENDENIFLSTEVSAPDSEISIAGLAGTANCETVGGYFLDS